MSWGRFQVLMRKFDSVAQINLETVLGDVPSAESRTHLSLKKPSPQLQIFCRNSPKALPRIFSKISHIFFHLPNSQKTNHQIIQEIPLRKSHGRNQRPDESTLRGHQNDLETTEGREEPQIQEPLHRSQQGSESCQTLLQNTAKQSPNEARQHHPWNETC